MDKDKTPHGDEQKGEVVFGADIGVQRRHKRTGGRGGGIAGSAWQAPVLRFGKPVLIVVAALLCVSVAWLAFRTQSGSGKAQVGACSDSVISGASSAIAEDSYADYTKYQREIPQLKNYQKDQNCVFIMLRIAMLRSNPVDARKYLTQLEKVYKADPGYSPAFTIRTYTPEQAEPMVVAIEQREKLIEEQNASNNAQLNAADRAADLAGPGGQQ